MFDAWIYKIVCKDESITDIYVGSTINVKRRRSAHRRACRNINNRGYNSKVYKYIRTHGGWDNWELVVIEQIKYKTKADKLLAERTNMEAIGATLNVEVPGRSTKEYSAAYNAANREKINKQSREYAKINRERIRKRDSEKITCQCGIIHNRSSKARHLRSAKHARLISQI